MMNIVVYAIHDFKAENKDELNFVMGEPITILEKDEDYQDGWWKGVNTRGEIGLFPMKYTTEDRLPPAVPFHLENPEQWSVQQVADWLGSVGLGLVANQFIEQEITGDILLDLCINNLKELGISTFGKRYKIMQAIQSLKGPTPTSSVSTGVLMNTKKHSLKRSKSQSNKDDRTVSSLKGEKIVDPILSLSMPIVLDEPRVETCEAPEHEGWLHKQSDKYKTWNKRWFVLKGVNLFYFKSPADVRMKGLINLRGYKMIVDETIHVGQYCFKLQHERERTFYFYTETKTSFIMWIKMLMKTSIVRDYRAPVLSSSQVNTVPLEVARRMRPRPPSTLMYKIKE